MRHVLLKGFLVRAYHDDIVLLHADRNVIRANETTAAAEHDGIIVDNSDGNLIEKNISHDNVQPISCGISVGHGARDNVVRDNLVYGNMNFGLLAGFPPFLGGPAGPGNVFVDNISIDNPGHGIGNNDTAGTHVIDNLVRHDGFRADMRNGINVFGPGSTGVKVEDNVVRLRQCPPWIFFRNGTHGTGSATTSRSGTATVSLMRTTATTTRSVTAPAAPQTDGATTRE